MTCDMIQKRPAVVTSSIASTVADNHRPARRPRENRVAIRPSSALSLSLSLSTVAISFLICSVVRPDACNRTLAACESFPNGSSRDSFVRFDGQSLDRIAIMQGCNVSLLSNGNSSRYILRWLPCPQFYLASGFCGN